MDKERKRVYGLALFDYNIGKMYGKKIFLEKNLTLTI